MQCWNNVATLTKQCRTDVATLCCAQISSLRIVPCKVTFRCHRVKKLTYIFLSVAEIRVGDARK